MSSSLPVVMKNGEQTIDARALHAFLENGKQFADWIKERIEQYDFKENLDFAVASPFSEASWGGQNRRDYALTVGMAKELCMVERNDKGRQARLYFIDCERRAKMMPSGLDALARQFEKINADSAKYVEGRQIEAVRAYLNGKAVRVSLAPTQHSVDQESRIKALLAEDPSRSANSIHRIVGGNTERVFRLVRKLRNA
jgi:phage anti-repressor protein